MTDALAPVLARIDAGARDHLACLVDHVRHPSISAQNIGMGEAAGILAGMLRSRTGMAVEIHPRPGHPMVLAQSPRIPGRPGRLIHGHYDVQPPEPLDAWATPPFEPAVRDGRLFARGVGDNKAQHPAHIPAIESWIAQHGALPCNVTLLIEGEEEVGSPDPPPAMSMSIRPGRPVARHHRGGTGAGRIGRPPARAADLSRATQQNQEGLAHGTRTFRP